MTLAIFLGVPRAGGYMFPLEVGSHYIRLACTSTVPFPDIVTSLGIAGGPLSHLTPLTAMVVRIGSSGPYRGGKVASALSLLASTNFH